MHTETRRPGISLLLLAVCLGWFTAFPSAARAASSQVILDRERDNVQPAPLSKPKLQIADERQAGAQADPGVSLRLNSLGVSGATAFTEEELLAPYRELYGTRIPYARLQEIGAELTRKYREAGYLLSRVVMPDQEADIDAADIRFIALEGYIESIRYSGDEGLVERFKRYFAPAEKILLGMKPLRHSVFERQMLLMNDVPGLDVSSRFERGTLPGASVLHVNVKADKVQGSFNWGNTGTDETGPHIGSAALELNTLPFIGNNTLVDYTQAADRREYWSARIVERYQMWNGLTFSASYAYSDSPEMDSQWARDNDYETESSTYTASVSYPFIRSRDLNLRAGLTYEHRDSEWVQFDYEGEDKLRTLSANLNFDFSDSFGGITQIIPTVSRGLDVFDASDKSEKASNKTAPADYWKFNLYLSRDQQLPRNFSLFTAAELQLASESLSSYNRFSFGGSQFGRGYDLGAVEGDNAFAASVEPRWTYYPTDNMALQLFSFADYGVVWATDRRENEKYSEEGSSVGAGIRLWGHAGSDMLPDFNISLYVAQPLQKVDSDDADSPRFVFQFGLFF